MMSIVKQLPYRLAEIQKQLWAIKHQFSEDLLDILIPILKKDESITCTFETTQTQSSVYRVAKVRFQKGEEYMIASGCIREPNLLPGLSLVQVAYMCSDFARNQALQSLFALRLNTDPIAEIAKELTELNSFIVRIDAAQTYEELKELAQAMDNFNFTQDEQDNLMEQLTNRNNAIKESNAK